MPGRIMRISRMTTIGATLRRFVGRLQLVPKLEPLKLRISGSVRGLCRGCERIVTRSVSEGWDQLATRLSLTLRVTVNTRRNVQLQKRELGNEDIENEGSFWPASGIRTWQVGLAMSVVLHVGLLVAFAFCYLSRRPTVFETSLDTHWSPTRTTQLDLTRVELVPHEHVPLAEPIGISMAGSAVPDRSSAESVLFPIPSPSVVLEQTSKPSRHLSATRDERADSMASPTATGTDRGVIESGKTGIGSAGGGGGFFGLVPDGRRFVFVLDASRSMNHPHPSPAKTRFKRVKMELLNALAALPQDSQFFLVFFNEQAIPMPSDGMELATPTMVKRSLYWAAQVPADGETDPTQAFALAQHLRPDVIYFLTDGWFHKKTSDELLRLSSGRATVHTFSFESEITPDVQQAKDLIRESRIREARRKFRTSVVREAMELVQSEEFLVELAHRTGGDYHRIP